jgi:hypothetical protein
VERNYGTYKALPLGTSLTSMRSPCKTLAGVVPLPDFQPLAPGVLMRGKEEQKYIRVRVGHQCQSSVSFLARQAIMNFSGLSPLNKPPQRMHSVQINSCT